MLNSSGDVMDGFVNLQEAVQAESKSRIERVEKLSGISAFLLLGAAIWLAWPALQSSMNGGPLIIGLGYPLIVLAWGIFVQDLGVMDEKTRSKIGAMATISWLPISIIAISQLEGELSQHFGMAILLVVSLYLFRFSRVILQGDIAVMKFRSLMGMLGFVLGASLLTTIDFDDNSSLIHHMYD